MLGCNETITLYNRYEDENGGPLLARTVIKGVSWRQSTKYVVGKSGADMADIVSVRIPAGADTGGKRYLPPFEWAAADKAACWTICGGDIAVKGECGYMENRISEIEGEHIAVKTYADNRAAPLPHWRLGAFHENLS